MKLVYTEQAILSLEEIVIFLQPDISEKKLIEQYNKILDKADSLLIHPLSGQIEPYLVDLGLGHRRLIEGHYKIIYRLEGEYIFITDIFDSRQDPDKMKP